MNEKIEILLKAIIAWMRNEGVAPTRTRIVKFLYLADLQHARYHGGRTFTGWRWRTDSFGPFATEALNLLDRGVNEGWLKTTILQREEGQARLEAQAGLADMESGRTFIYDLPDFATVERAKEDAPLGFGAVRNWIKKYGSDTNALLRFVYGNTEPMENAVEGVTLDFTTARPISVAKPIPGRKLTTQERQKLNDLLTRMRAKYQAIQLANKAMHWGPYDDAYYEGLPRETETPAGTIVLRFPKKND